MTDGARDRYVYALYAGEQTKPCYIGVGKSERRMRDHMAEARRGSVRRNPRKCRTLIACLKRGICVEPRKIAWNMTLTEALAVEISLIAHYGRRDLGTGWLLNACDGGFGSRNPCDSSRKRMSRPGNGHHLFGKKLSAEHREKIRAANVGKAVSKEHREKLAAAHLGKKLTSEHRAKLAAYCGENNSRYGTRHSAGTLAKMSARQKQRSPISDGIRAKIAEAARRQWANPEYRAKMVAANIGKKHSPETRAKMSAAHRKKTDG